MAKKSTKQVTAADVAFVEWLPEAGTIRNRAIAAWAAEERIKELEAGIATQRAYLAEMLAEAEKAAAQEWKPEEIAEAKRQAKEHGRPRY